MRGYNNGVSAGRDRGFEYNNSNSYGNQNAINNNINNNHNSNNSNHSNNNNVSKAFGRGDDQENSNVQNKMSDLEKEQLLLQQQKIRNQHAALQMKKRQQQKQQQQQQQQRHHGEIASSGDEYEFQSENKGDMVHVSVNGQQQHPRISGEEDAPHADTFDSPLVRRVARGPSLKVHH
jgi:hypothetical protein